ncbi:adenosine kinase [Prochlorococcus marinus]|uniref:adenosine kinase n=1 Tax=Prochlorococcus marinus TaxID=1219 RepID=UPI0022B59664|nr:adenosine kinase [Prochlorococcus marinus]
MKTKKYDVVGIGNAIVDILIKTEDSFLLENSLPKGNMKLINETEAEYLYSKSGAGIETSGGSAANTIAGLSKLGIKTGFIGRVREDQLGNIFMHDIRSTGVLFNTPIIKDGPSTARCLIYVTPDAERTMCTYLGASVFLDTKDLDLSLVRETKILYLEGYLWDQSSAKSALEISAKECKDYGGKVALSLSDSFCIERHRESFKRLIENHVDIIFANESEIISLYESEDFKAAMEIIRPKCKIAVLTRGKEGSVIIEKNNTYFIDSYNLGKAIDTTGAGDLYASGFLYGYTNNKDLQACGQLGAICSGHIVTQFGPRSEASLSDLIKKYC